MESVTDVVATIYNRHIPECGTPPNLDSRKCLSLGTFTDCFGEQWVLVAETGPMKTGRDNTTFSPVDFYLICADYSWDTKWRLKSNPPFGPASYSFYSDKVNVPLSLSRAVKLWFLAYWELWFCGGSSRRWVYEEEWDKEVPRQHGPEPDWCHEMSTMLL